MDELEVSDMPPLTDEVHAELRVLERKLYAAISECVSNYDLLDPQAAFEYLRTFAIKFYNTYYGFYSQYPEYESHWQSAAEKFAFGRVVKCATSYTSIRNFLATDSTRVPRIKKTIRKHAEATRKTPKKAHSLFPNPDDWLKGMLNTPTTPPTFQVISKLRFATELRRLLNEARLKPERIAEEIRIQPRNVYRHLSGENAPSLTHVGKYEEVLTRALGRKITLPTPDRRQNASKTSSKRQ